MSVIKINNFTFSYLDSTKLSLKKINLKISKGEFIAIIGPNNSGKSTLCYSLTGVIPNIYPGKIQGDIQINEHDIKSKTVAEISNEAGLVMDIPQNQLSGIRETVFEEVAFSLENRGVPRDKIITQVSKTLKKVSIENIARRSPQELSGGQQQKVVLASVLANDPDILILDEPTTFLDPQSSKQVFAILQQLQLEGKTVIIAEQNIELIAVYASRVLVIDNGEIIMDGPPSNVLTDSILEQVGLDYLRYTKVSKLAENKEIWNSQKLSITLQETIKGLENV